MKRTRATAITLGLVAALAALALVACGEDGADDTTTTTSTTTAAADAAGEGEGPMSAPLDGTTFQSTSVTGYDLVDGSTVRLAFADGQLSANAGCNTIGGAYEVDGDSLTVAGEMRSTMMGCDAALSDQDLWLTDWIRAGLRWQLADGILTLSGDDVTMTLEAESTGEGTVEGSWTLDTIMSDSVASNVPAGVEPPTLEISGDEVAVFTGCNRGGGSIEIGADTITFGPMRLTRMACEQPAMDLEAAITALLQGEVAFSLEGDRLTLGDETSGLVWRRTA